MKDAAALEASGGGGGGGTPCVPCGVNRRSGLAVSTAELGGTVLDAAAST